MLPSTGADPSGRGHGSSTLLIILVCATVLLTVILAMVAFHRRRQARLAPGFFEGATSCNGPSLAQMSLQRHTRGSADDATLVSYNAAPLREHREPSNSGIGQPPPAASDPAQISYDCPALRLHGVPSDMHPA